jgi:hypothetical protein
MQDNGSPPVRLRARQPGTVAVPGLLDGRSSASSPSPPMGTGRGTPPFPERRARDAGRAAGDPRRRSCTRRPAGVWSGGTRRPRPTGVVSRCRGRREQAGRWRPPAPSELPSAAATSTASSRTAHSPARCWRPAWREGIALDELRSPNRPRDCRAFGVFGWLLVESRENRFVATSVGRSGVVSSDRLTPPAWDARTGSEGSVALRAQPIVATRPHQSDSRYCASR